MKIRVRFNLWTGPCKPAGVVRGNQGIGFKSPFNGEALWRNIFLRHREVMMGVRQGRMEYAVVVPFIIHVLCLYNIAKGIP